MQPTVYILASKRNGSLYIGVTSNLVGRIWQHKQGIFDGFTKRYGINQLVYYETCPRMEDAIVREKQLKEWHRAWKLRLIEEDNPDWRDLWPEVCEADEEVTKRRD
jgi:putative endonuclease